MSTHKITVNKSDEVTLVVEKIIDSEAKEIVLAVPRFSRLIESEANFRLLKREAEALGKKLVIESVDDSVMQFSEKHGLECVNPFFAESKRQFHDIVTHKSKSVPQIQLAKAEKIPSVAAKTAGEEKKTVIEPEKPKARLIGLRLRFLPSFKTSALIILALLLVAGVAGAFQILPRATINIKTAKTTWAYNDAVVVDKAAGESEPEQSKVPGQIFSQRKNLQLSFPATGKKQVTRKATGTIIIYNAHSSEPQPLVATTRFQTPDGKIFRLVDRITVPGAKVVSGQIQPSSIEAKVAADKAGEAYNIGPVARFTIPGFAGTPKALAFYGESRAPMTGGFIGESAFPTDEDIKKAKQLTLQNLEEAIRTFTLAQLPPEFKLIEGAENFRVISQKVDTDVDSEGKFSVFAEAEVSVMVFREQDLLAMLLKKLAAETDDAFEVRGYTLEYGPARFNAGAGELTFSVGYESTLAKKIDVGLLKQRIAGQTENQLKAVIFSFPGLDSATANLWPLWVRRVPNNLEKIEVTID